MRRIFTYSRKSIQKRVRRNFKTFYNQIMVVNSMKRKLLELFDDVFNALDDLMYSKFIDIEKFRELDDSVKTPLVEIFNELNKNQNFGKSSK